MTTTPEAGDLIKVDCIGRARRDALLNAYDASGLSGPEFAPRHGVKYPTFATWLQKRKRRTGQYPVDPSSHGARPFSLLLAEVEPVGPGVPSVGPLGVILPGGASITLRDESQLDLAAKLIREITKSC